MRKITKSKSVGHRRLDQLATFLYRVPAARFYMGGWFSSELTGIGRHPESLESKECNSAACAVGWATVIFKNEGLLLEPTRDFLLACCPRFRRKNGELLTNWPAVTDFFGICQRDADNLFGADKNEGAGPRQIAKKIRAFLRSKKYSQLIKDLKNHEKHTR